DSVTTPLLSFWLTEKQNCKRDRRYTGHYRNVVRDTHTFTVCAQAQTYEYTHFCTHTHTHTSQFQSLQKLSQVLAVVFDGCLSRWVAWAPGIPKCIDAKTETDLHQDVRFDNEKRSDFEGSLHYALLELSLKKLAIRFGKSWDDLDDFKRCFWKLRSPISGRVQWHIQWGKKVFSQPPIVQVLSLKR
uniref:Lipoxygenase domain-containing protein n=1 Tax=Hucho hucho TaxID=62062 RepID=A0A4W5MDM4_9TELE